MVRFLTGVPTRYWEGAPDFANKLPKYFLKLHVTPPSIGVLLIVVFTINNLREHIL